MRTPLGDSSLLSYFEFEVLDGNDLPHSWVGRKVGVETVSAPGMLVGWLQSKSTWRLEIVEHGTGELFCVPWIAVEAIVLVEEESGVPGSPETVAEGADQGTPRSAGGGPQQTSESPWWRRMFGGGR
jgi:hypothetical protein